MAGQRNIVVVIDIGYKYTKLGVSGDTHPRCIIPTTIRDPITGKIKNVFDYKHKDELYHNLIDFIHYLYLKKILLSPKDSRVVIVDSLVGSIQIRETLAKALFCHLQISSLLMVPSHLVSLYTLGVSTALVLDIGYQEACLIPVFEGYPVLHAYEAQPLGGQAVETNLRKLLNEYYSEYEPSKLELVHNLSDKTIEDIKVRLCFVTKLERAHKIEAGEEVSPPPCVDYDLSGSDVLKVRGKIRESACEVLFHLDADEISLTTMILNSLLKCPVDMRKTLARNILLIGGTASIPGIKSRILSELRYHVETSKYKDKLFIKEFMMHSSPSKENYTAWLGGSLVGATDMVTVHSVTKETYSKERDMPDWANLKYNTNSSHVLLK